MAAVSTLRVPESMTTPYADRARAKLTFFLDDIDQNGLRVSLQGIAVPAAAGLHESVHVVLS